MQVQIPIEFRPVLGLGDEVPNFSAKTQKGSLTFHDYILDLGLFVSHTFINIIILSIYFSREEIYICILSISI